MVLYASAAAACGALLVCAYVGWRWQQQRRRRRRIYTDPDEELRTAGRRSRLGVDDKAGRSGGGGAADGEERRATTPMRVPVRLAAAFERFDTDHSGFIDRRELRAVLHHYGVDLSEHGVLGVLARYDEQPNGQMELDEFAELVRDLEEGVLRAEPTVRPPVAAPSPPKPPTSRYPPPPPPDTTPERARSRQLRQQLAKCTRAHIAKLDVAELTKLIEDAERQGALGLAGQWATEGSAELRRAKAKLAEAREAQEATALKTARQAAEKEKAVRAKAEAKAKAKAAAAEKKAAAVAAEAAAAAAAAAEAMACLQAATAAATAPLRVVASRLPVQVVQAFDCFDADHSGLISCAELHDALRHYGIDLSGPGAAAVLARYDDTPDGQMDLSKFAELVRDLDEGAIRSTHTAKSGGARLEISLRRDSRGRFMIKLERDEGGLFVRSVDASDVDDDRARLQPHDYIHAIDHHAASGLELAAASEIMKRAGEELVLSLERPPSAPTAVDTTAVTHTTTTNRHAAAGLPSTPRPAMVDQGLHMDAAKLHERGGKLPAQGEAQRHRAREAGLPAPEVARNEEEETKGEAKEEAKGEAHLREEDGYDDPQRTRAAHRADEAREKLDCARRLRTMHSELSTPTATLPVSPVTRLARPTPQPSAPPHVPPPEPPPVVPLPAVSPPRAKVRWPDEQPDVTPSAPSASTPLSSLPARTARAVISAVETTANATAGAAAAPSTALPLTKQLLIATGLSAVLDRPAASAQLSFEMTAAKVGCWQERAATKLEPTKGAAAGSADMTRAAMAGSPITSRSPTSQATSSTLSSPGGAGVDVHKIDKPVAEALNQSRLLKFVVPLVQLGVCDVCDAAEVTEEDLVAMGMAELQRRRYHEAVLRLPPPAGSAPDSSTGSGAQSQLPHQQLALILDAHKLDKPVADALTRARLLKFATPLVQLGVCGVFDMAEVAERDLLAMGMSVLQQRRFQKAVLLLPYTTATSALSSSAKVPPSDHALAAMHPSVMEWLERCRLASYAEGFSALGVEELADLSEVTADDLGAMGLPELQSRRFSANRQRSPSEVADALNTAIEAKVGCKLAASISPASSAKMSAKMAAKEKAPDGNKAAGGAAGAAVPSSTASSSTALSRQASASHPSRPAGAQAGAPAKLPQPSCGRDYFEQFGFDIGGRGSAK